MKLGLFTMPSHPPERDLREGHEWDLQVLRWADEYGYGDAWIGEHHTAPWEPHPSPDYLVLEGFRQTENLRIGPGGFLLPYHHPVELANRVAMLDHLSQGRLNFGIAAGGLPSDYEMFGTDGLNGENRDMTREAIEIIMNLWSQEPGWSFQGKYWKASIPEPMVPGGGSLTDGLLRQHLKPLQDPYPPISVAGLSSPSSTLEMAGANGWMPLSLNLNTNYVKSHWDSVQTGADKAGVTASRSNWHLVREIFVADTDEEAWKQSVDSMMGRMMREYFLPLLGAFEYLDFLKDDPSVPTSEVTVEYCAEHNWWIGSPDTVVQKIEKTYAECGGFGGVLLFGFDYAENSEPWRRSMELLAKEVMPRVAHLTGD